MRRSHWLFLLLPVCLGLCSFSVCSAETPVKVIAISYHDVRDNVDADIDADETAVASKKLVEQFEWIRQNGYQSISMQQLQNVSATNPLPAKPVLLTFDDGYSSCYTRIFPLLKLYRYPAVMALVGRWLDTPAGQLVQYGNEKVPRDHFLTQSQINEMQASGLVEFASHSYDLHKGIIANPQGNVQPAAVTALYDPIHKQYESQAALEKRIYQDLKKNHQRIKQLTGVAPDVMVWPYGEWSEVAEKVARKLGYHWFLLLGDESKTDLAKGRINRILLTHNPGIGDFSAAVQPFKPDANVVRAAHVDLDYVYDKDPIQMTANIDRLLERIKNLKISTVYLQAFADPDGDGNADAMYFPNDELPMRADIFNRVAWQLRTRANVRVYAWMPVMAFDFGNAFYQQHGVRTWHETGITTSVADYRRLSIFDDVARKKIQSIYRDLALHANFYGVLFHDDAMLDQNEDFHPSGSAFFASRGLDINSYAHWQNDPEKRQQFTDSKIKAINDFTVVLLNEVRQFRPDVRSARNLYAETVLNPESERWFAQSLPSALQQYDHVAVLAMPWMEKAADPEAWTRTLIVALQDVPAADKKRLVIELQARDWRNNQPISAADFSQQVSLWKQAGYQNYAWYPDDFIANVPEFSTLYRLLSLEDFPYQRR